MNGNEENQATTASATRLRRMLDELAPDLEAGPDSSGFCSSLYLTPEAAKDPRKALVGAGAGWSERLRELGPAAAALGCGVVGLRSGSRGLLIAPPFPVRETRLLPGWDDSPLRELLENQFTVGVVLVRLGRFSVATYRGGKLNASKTDSRYVKGKHHAGGTSQLRYTRVREGQIRRLYDKVCEEVRERLDPGGLDYVFLGGEKFTLNGLLRHCPALAALSAITLPRRLNIRDPKRDTLEQVGVMLSESRVWRVEFD